MATDDAAHDRKYVSVTGTAVVSNDRAGIKQLVKMAAAAMTGSRPTIGDNRKVAM